MHAALGRHSPQRKAQSNGADTQRGRLFFSPDRSLLARHRRAPENLRRLTCGADGEGPNVLCGSASNVPCGSASNVLCGSDGRGDGGRAALCSDDVGPMNPFHIGPPHRTEIGPTIGSVRLSTSRGVASVRDPTTIRRHAVQPRLEGLPRYHYGLDWKDGRLDVADPTTSRRRRQAEGVASTSAARDGLHCRTPGALRVRKDGWDSGRAITNMP